VVEGAADIADEVLPVVFASCPDERNRSGRRPSCGCGGLLSSSHGLL